MKNQDFILTNNPNNINWEEIKLFFLFDHEAINPEEFTIMPLDTKLEELLVISGSFNSKNIARKAGFSGPINKGFIKSGTKKNPIWILKDF